jgi:hypothetical protein
MSRWKPISTRSTSKVTRLMISNRQWQPWESEIGPALTRIAEAKSLDNEDDRAWLLNLIGLLLVRNPRFREMMRSLSEGVSRRIMDAALSSRALWESQVKQAKAAGALPQNADMDYDKIKQSYKPEAYKLVVANEAHLANEMQAFEHALPALFARNWRLVEAPADSPGFVTSDHPVSLTSAEPLPGGQSPGLRTPRSRVFFPITPKLAIVGTIDPQSGETTTLTEDEVAAANADTILNAQRQVYTKTGDFRYRIDPAQPLRAASELVTDECFLRLAKPALVQ